MHISVTCENCGKVYQVDAKLGGRKVKCKACSQPITIPRTDAPAPGDDLLAGLNAAAEAEQRSPTPHHAAPAPRPPAGESLQQPAAYASQPAYAPPQPRPHAPAYVSDEVADQFQRDGDNFRINVPYTNPFFAGVESIALFLAQALFWFAFAIACLFSVWILCVAVGASVQGKAVLWGKVFSLVLFPPLYFGFIYFILTNLNVLAAYLAGKALMFHLPESDNRWRVIAASLAALLPQILIFMLLFPLLWAREHSMSEGFFEGYARSAALTIFFFPLNIILHFLFTWLMLRLRFLESILAWLFMLIMNILISLAVTFVLFLIGLAMR